MLSHTGTSTGAQYVLAASFGIFAITGFALAYLASLFLLTVVAYLSVWVPVWMWIADIGLFTHAVALAATSTVGAIAAIITRIKALKLCSSILIGMVLLEIGVTVQLGTRRDSLDMAVESDLHGSMSRSMSFYSANISDTQMWDEIQIEVNCCGVASYEDWFATGFDNGYSVPDSCCLLITQGCGQDIKNSVDPSDEIITEGCLPILMQRLRLDFNRYGYGLWIPILVSQIVLLVYIVYAARRTTKYQYNPAHVYVSPNMPAVTIGNEHKYDKLDETIRVYGA